ncbi:hypothetical protein LDENG_00000440, partial [Lucifuga dentata]
PRRAPYPEREGYGVVDFYEKYRARPYSAMGYDDRRPSAIPPPPPPPSALVRERIGMAPHDPYERRPLPPPPPAFLARDRSPIRRALPTSTPAAGNGYSYERCPPQGFVSRPSAATTPSLPRLLSAEDCDTRFRI